MIWHFINLFIVFMLLGVVFPFFANSFVNLEWFITENIKDWSKFERASLLAYWVICFVISLFLACFEVSITLYEEEEEIDRK